MGIFGALTTAVTGMRAQSYALENISGNIANSQTTAFKRIDSTFVDLIPDNDPNKQVSGSVIANSRSTNGVQGDIQNSSIGTFMAINGEGFFVVQKPSNFADNTPVFDGIDRYTRRGDFEIDRDGYLVNGAGYYLMGIPVDPTTGNVTGSIPQLLQFANDFLPAQPTTQVTYRANLASYPLTPGHDSDIPGSELLNPANFSASPVAGPPSNATILGSGAALDGDAPALLTGTTNLAAFTSVAGGTLEINGTPVTVNAGDNTAAILAAINLQSGTTGVTATLNGSNRIELETGDADSNVVIGNASTLTLLNDLGIAVGTTFASNLITQGAASNPQTLTFEVDGFAQHVITFGFGVGEVSTMADLAAELALISGASGTIDGDGNITVAANNATSHITVGGDASMLNFGIQTLNAMPSNGTVVARDLDAFVNSSIGGGAITAYDVSGSPVNVQLRWAKVDSALSGGTDTWNLFYQSNSNATGTQEAWRNAGINFAFGPNGQMVPPVTSLTLNNMTVNGVDLGNLAVSFGAGGITQFADPNGAVQVNMLQQNGYAAGDLQQVSVNDKGRVVGSYSNGRSIDLAEITLANFNGTNGLKRIDGGAFEATDASGPAMYNAPGRIVASSLEGSNTDIADEFTKLIVTQQAYSANTRVITTTNDMMQELLNMLR
jgi:flagellar hook protein FlgE